MLVPPSSISFDNEISLMLISNWRWSSIVPISSLTASILLPSRNPWDSTAAWSAPGTPPLDNRKWPSRLLINGSSFDPPRLVPIVPTNCLSPGAPFNGSIKTSPFSATISFLFPGISRGAPPVSSTLEPAPSTKSPVFDTEKSPLLDNAGSPFFGCTIKKPGPFIAISVSSPVGLSWPCLFEKPFPPSWIANTLESEWFYF